MRVSSNDELLGLYAMKDICAWAVQRVKELEQENAELRKQLGLQETMTPYEWTTDNEDRQRTRAGESDRGSEQDHAAHVRQKASKRDRLLRRQEESRSSSERIRTGGEMLHEAVAADVVAKSEESSSRRKTQDAARTTEDEALLARVRARINKLKQGREREYEEQLVRILGSLKALQGDRS